ncbi:hypothetical protein WR25_23336 [Diploscapter pachys]|uniref:Uncharacterized protein n=1 Tax=Diploscapter pachys TaxID=2018661 RepID=A0A2A2KJ47_9BILA|nr:hypothetical protein WR25_23336 [Diploscapter pachys]
MVHYDSILIFLSAVLLAMTYFRLGSAFFVFNYVFFPLLREPLIYLLGRFGVIKKVTPSVSFYTQLICFTPNFFFSAYAISQSIDFFVPVMGRLGNAINPEYLIGPMGLVIASTFVFFVSNLIYASRKMSFFLKCGFAIYAFFVALLLTTKLGVPYDYTIENPRLRRIIALHSNRTIYDFNGKIEKADNGLFIHSLDYRGGRDLPSHSFLQGSAKPDCSNIKDEYCRLPYYTACVNLKRCSDSLWVPVPSSGYIPDPIKLKVVEKQKIGSNQLNVTFELRGGYDKMSLHITPLAGYELKKWSFTDFKPETFGKRTTYFVFLAYGFEKPEFRNFWILLENPNTSAEMHDPKKAPNLEIAVASHHAHGRHQDSETLTQLRQLIASRRQSPEMAVGWWRWGITMIGGISQIVVHVV